MSLTAPLFCDANVLYPSLLRDLLIRLALADVTELQWSDAVQEEWTRNLLEHRPDLHRSQLRRTLERMEAALPGARVTGFEPLIPSLSLPDPDDRHVLAAALHAGARLLTFNLRDFPTNQTRGVEIVHPDRCLTDLIAEFPGEVLSVLSEMSASLRRPPMSEEMIVRGLANLGLTQAATRLEVLLRGDLPE